MKVHAKVIVMVARAHALEHANLAQAHVLDHAWKHAGVRVKTHAEAHVREVVWVKLRVLQDVNQHVQVNV